MSAARFVLAFTASAVLLTAASAGAFTYDNRTNQSPEVQAQLRGQEGQLSNGMKIGNSHFSMQFSGGGYGNGQSGIENRFVPSSNPDFANPYYSPNNLDTALANHH